MNRIGWCHERLGQFSQAQHFYGKQKQKQK